MTIGQLPLPARYAARDHFKVAYAQAQRAAEKLSDREAESFDAMTEAEVKEINRLLAEASCAARALENILVGNPLPRRGE